MIKRVEIKGLRGYKKNVIVISFNKDINILTGINGIGKTTILKLIWYTYSGNLSRATHEIDFDSIEMITSTKIIRIFRIDQDKANEKEYNLEHHSGYDIYVEDTETKKVILDTENELEPLFIGYCEDKVSEMNGNSLYFPTFRMIEGFSKQRNNHSEFRFYQEESEEQILNKALKRISENISRNGHKYITSVSTRDINELLTNKYAEISEVVNTNYKELSDEIETSISNNSATNDSSHLYKQLNKIKDLLSDNKHQRENFFAPINRINDIVEDIFLRKGIVIGNTLSFGEKKENIESELLSAGEKQMLGFISYNAFYKKIPIIIDEPEISLHVDWQRRLLSVLDSQETNNQIIVASHSPFIYSKYSDKEIYLDKENLVYE